MFTVDERSRVVDVLVERAASDARVVAAAIVGSLADDEGDEWSDVDLTMGVRDGVAIAEVLDDWTGAMAAEFDAVPLFDLRAGATTYRVFLLPRCLQVDLSFAPASAFRAASARFRLVFGSPTPAQAPAPAAAHDLFGWAVVYALAARRSVARGRPWQADYSIAAVRDRALSLACARRGLPAQHGRAFDELPAAVLERFADARARSLDEGELLRALATVVDGLLREAEPAVEAAPHVAAALRDLVASR